jgi:hypothetical protein
MKIFLDDLRHAPDSTWIVARSYVEFIDLVRKSHDITHLSFDHDLGEDVPTGLDAAKFFIDRAMDLPETVQSLQIVNIHSANPPGAANIRGLFLSAQKHGIIPEDVVIT